MFQMYSKCVYNFMCTRFKREANTFILLCTCVLHTKQTHLLFCAHAFHTRRTRACVYALKLARVFPGGEYICAKCWFIVTMRDYIPLVSVEYSWLALLVAQRSGTALRWPLPCTLTVSLCYSHLTPVSIALPGLLGYESWWPLLALLVFVTRATMTPQ